VNWAPPPRRRPRLAAAAIAAGVSLPAFVACIAQASDPFSHTRPPHGHGHVHHGNPHNVPEPATLALLGVGAGAVVLIRRMRK